MICPQTKEDCQFKACAIGRWCAKAHSNTIASRADALSRITTAEPFALPITADEFAAMARDAERWRWLLAQFGTVKTEHFIVSGTFDSELARLVDKYAMAERNK